LIDELVEREELSGPSGPTCSCGAGFECGSAFVCRTYDCT